MKYNNDNSRSAKTQHSGCRRFGSFLRELFFSREFIRYFFSGVVATIVNLAVFTLMNRWLGLGQWYFSNLPAIVLSVLTAYVLNRIWVFRSKSDIKKEFVRFVGSRLMISLICEYAVYPLFYYGFGVQQEIISGLTYAKIIAMLFVVVANRVTGKLFVFSDEREE